YLINKAEAKVLVVEKDPVKAFTIITLQVMTPADAIAALGAIYADVQAKSLSNNRLLISGDAKRLDAVKALFATIDVPTRGGAALMEKTEATYMVKFLVPWQAKSYLEEVYKGQGLTVSYAPNHRWQGSFATGPDAPTGPAPAAAEGATTAGLWDSNELILRGPKSVIVDALASVQAIDVNAPLTQKRCHVERIYATQAMAYLLGQFESSGLTIVTAPMTFTPGASSEKGATAVAPSTSIGTKVVRDKTGKLNVTEPVGDFMLIGTESVVRDAEASLAKIDVGPEKVFRIYTLRFLRVDEAKAKLNELFGMQGLQVSTAPSKRGDTPTVVSNDNADTGGSKPVTGDAAMQKIFDLILVGPSDVVTRAETLLAALDTESAQISIRAEIVSVDSTATRQLGIEWPGTVTVGMKEAASGEVLKLGRILRDPIAFNATLNMLQTQNKAKLISQPSTVVQNGREALIHVGDKILYEIVSGYSNGTPIFSTTEVDAGVTLRVLPQMSKDGVITLEISTIVSQLVGFNKGTSGAELPQISETKSATSVQVHDGETLVIGGLTQNGLTINRSGLPVLGNLPLVGSLFSRKTTTPVSKDLLIMVTPRLMQSLLGNATPVVAPSK
ncbi:MAG TPA: hypothetical protein VGL77_09580, partial [Armatimonadota bacterium]